MHQTESETHAAPPEDRAASAASGTATAKKRPRRKRLYMLCAAVLALALAATLILPGLLGGGEEDDTAGGESNLLARPDGDPSGQTAEDNLYICMGVMQQTTYRSVTTGTAKAKVGFIDYTQQVHNERVVTADSVFTEAVSTSLLKNMGEQKYFKDGAILVRYAASVNAEHTQWSDDIIAISQEDYEAAYGQDPRNLTNYVVSQDTVQNAVMEETGDGTYAITFDLEPEGASVYYKRQVRTYGGASKNPIFHSVHMVWTIDSEWRILQMDTVENYDIVMPGIGSPNCTGTLTEVFSDFGAVTDDQAAFQKYLETEYDPNNLGKLNEAEDTQKIIQDFFLRTPDYRVTVSANGKSYTLDVHVDLAANAFQARGTIEGVNLFAAYAGNRLYLHAGSQKIVLAASDTLDAARLVAGTLGVQIPDISLDQSTISRLMNSVSIQETSGGMVVTLSDSMISGTISLKNPDALRLVRANLRLNLGGLSCAVTAVPGSGFQTESLSGYTDLTGALSLVSPIIDVVNARGYLFDVDFSGYGVSLSGRATLSRTDSGLAAGVTTTVDGVDLSAQYVGNTLYVSAGAIHLSGTMDDIRQMVAKVMELTGAQGSPDAVAATYAQFFQNITPQSAIDSIRALSWSGSTLSATLAIGGNTVNAALTSNSVAVDDGSMRIAVRLLQTYQTAPEIVPSGSDYVRLADLMPFCGTLERYVGAQGMDLDAELTINGYPLHADVVLSFGTPVAARAVSSVMGRDLTATLYQDEVYISYGRIQVRCSTDNLRQTLYTVLAFVPGIDRQTVEDTIDAYEYFFEHLSFAEIVGAISSFRYESGQLLITANIAAEPLYLALTPEHIVLDTAVDTVTLHADVTPGQAYVSAPDLVPAGNYRDLDELLGLLGSLSA